MPSKRIDFFATRSDLEPLLTSVERKRPVKYVEAGLFDASTVAEWTSFTDIPQFGVATRGDTNQEPEFLVAPAQTVVQVRTVPQRRGGSKFAVDQEVNGDSIALRPGGRLGSVAVIAGRVGTVSDSAESRSLFDDVARELKQRFTKIRSYQVGAEAERLLDGGYRLTASIRSPPLYDLKR